MYKIPEAFKAGFGRLRKVARLPKAPQRSRGEPGVITLDSAEPGRPSRLAGASGEPLATPFAAMPVSKDSSLGRTWQREQSQLQQGQPPRQGQGSRGLSWQHFSMPWGRSRGAQREQPSQGLPSAVEPARQSAGGVPSPGKMRRGSAPAQQIQDMEAPHVSRLSRLGELQPDGLGPQQAAARPHPHTGALMQIEFVSSRPGVLPPDQCPCWCTPLLQKGTMWTCFCWCSELHGCSIDDCLVEQRCVLRAVPCLGELVS